MTTGELVGFGVLSIFGGLLGCAAASAHRLVTPLPAKLFLSVVAIFLTIVTLMIGTCALGYGVAAAGPLLHANGRIDWSQVGNLAVYVSLFGTYLTTILGYFTLVAYGVGFVLCTILQHAGRRPRPVSTITVR